MESKSVCRGWQLKRKSLAKLGRMVVKGGRDQEGVLKWPVIEDKKAERGRSMRGRDPLVVPGAPYMMKIARKKRIGSMEILYNR